MESNTTLLSSNDDIESGIDKKTGTNIIPDWLHMTGTIIGLYFCYIVSTIMQESMYGYRSTKNIEVHGDRFESASLLSFTKSIMCVVVSWVALKFRKDKPVYISGYAAVLSATLRCFASIVTLYSLNFISYPHAILGKCVKILPVLVFEFFFDNKIPSIRKVLSVFLTTIGMIIFSSNNFNSQEKISAQSSSWFGLSLLILGLCMDGALASAQNRMMKIPERKPGVFDTMLYMNIWQSGISAILAIYSWEGKGGFVFCMNNMYVTYMGLSSALIEAFGQFFIYALVIGHGPLTTAFVTTLRKFCTILLSIIVFGHSITFFQWIGIGTIFTGVSMDVFFKIKTKRLPK